MNAQYLSIPAISSRLKTGQGKPNQSSLQAGNVWDWNAQKEARPLLTNVPGLIYQFLLRKDGSLSFLFLSPTFQEFFEVDSPDMELDTETLISMIHPDDVADFHDSITEAAGMLKSWRWAGRFILPSGQTKWIQWDAQPSLQTNGNIFWNGLLVDVTSQQQLNAEVERLSFLLGLTERLQDSSEIKEIAEFALNYLVQSTNCNFGDVKEISGIDDKCQACALTNYVSAELVTACGEPVLAELEAALRRGIPKGQGLMWQVVETGKPLFIKDYANHPNSVPAFRHPAIGHIGIFPIPATDGTVMGVLTLEAQNLEKIQDTTQQEMLLAACRILGVRMERVKDRERLALANADLESTSQNLRQKAEELEQTLQELQQAQIHLVQSEKMSSLGQLVAGVAHEINNPVSFIHGNISHADRYFKDLLSLLQLYRQHYSPPVPEIQATIEELDLDFMMQDLPKLMSSMKVGAERIRDIVRSLRNFSRLDQADKKTVDIHEGIENTLLILNNRLKEQSNRPQVQIIKEYGDLPPVECYAGQINQVLMNIIANAIDALEDATKSCLIVNRKEFQRIPTLRIRTEVVENSRIQITITDNGIGIAKSIQARIFDPFFTTKPVGKGTGLGLSISHRIVTEQHGGELKCTSVVGEGTEFAIVLPHALSERNSAKAE